MNGFGGFQGLGLGLPIDSSYIGHVSCLSAHPDT